MPRGSGSRRSSSSSGGGGWFGGGGSSRRAAPPPAPAQHAPPPAPATSGGGGFMSNMMGSVASGMATGVGFGVAQRAVDSVLGGRQMEVVHTHQDPAVAASAPVAAAPAPYQQPQGGNCRYEMDELNQCLSNNSDISLCQSLVDSLKACQRS